MNSKPPSNELVRIFKAFGYSLQGLKFGLEQAAFRTELVLFCMLTPIAFWVTADSVERALMIGSILLIIIVELLNSAIEATIDRISLEKHELSGQAKDMASAAVLLSLINAALVWGCIILG